MDHEREDSALSDSSDMQAEAWSGNVRATIKWQMILGLIATVGVAIWLGLWFGLAVLYGVAFASLNSFWLARRVERAAVLDQITGQRILYLGAVLRFVALLGALVLAHLLGLHLLAVAGGLLVAQLALFGYPALRSKIES